jgi:uncharacterized protein
MKKILINSDRTYVSRTKNTGRGIFAIRDIRKGELIAIFKGGTKKVIIRSKRDSENFVGTHLLGLNKNLWLVPKKIDPLYYVNHSCNPNSGIKGAVRLYSMRKIKKGEEITFDYSTTEGDIFWEMKCNCGILGCRKIIRSIQFIPENNFKKYLPYVPSYFRDIYIKYKSKK